MLTAKIYQHKQVQGIFKRIHNMYNHEIDELKDFNVFSNVFGNAFQQLKVKVNIN